MANRIVNIPLSRIHEPASNPNVLGDQQFGLLIESMLRRAGAGSVGEDGELVGYAQPILVRPDGDGFEIVDGVHRSRAVKAILEMDTSLLLEDRDREYVERVVQFQQAYADGSIECVVRDMTTEQARVLQISMNKLRGELDLGQVARTLNELLEEGCDVNAMVSGFSEEEVAALVESVSDEPDLSPNVGALPEEPDEKPIKPFVLELTFSTKEELSRAKRGLRKAGGGKGADLARGLLNLIDGA